MTGSCSAFSSGSLGEEPPGMRNVVAAEFGVIGEGSGRGRGGGRSVCVCVVVVVGCSTLICRLVVDVGAEGG